MTSEIKRLAKDACQYARNMAKDSTLLPDQFNTRSFSARERSYIRYDLLGQRFLPLKLASNNRAVTEKEYNHLNIIYNACFAIERQYFKCRQLSSLAFLYIIKHIEKNNIYETISAEIWDSYSADHTFVVIKNKQTNNDADQYVCDPSLNNCYHWREIRIKGKKLYFDPETYTNNYITIGINSLTSFSPYGSTNFFFTYNKSLFRSKSILEQVVNHYFVKQPALWEKECHKTVIENFPKLLLL